MISSTRHRSITNALGIAITLVGLLAAASLVLGSEVRSPAVVRVGSGCSGVCVSPTGLVVTARHCISHPGQIISIEFASPGRRNGAVVHVASQSDLAVVRVPAGDLPFVRVASQPPAVGDPVYAEGFPAGQYARMEGTVTYVGTRQFSGNLFRSSYPAPLETRGVPAFPDLDVIPSRETVRVIETSFRIQRGFSGGGLFNRDGELVGIASMVPAGEQNVRSIWMHTLDIRAALTAAGYTEPDVRLPALPTLYVFVSAGCGPCETFKTDYGVNAVPASPELRQALDRSFQVRLMDFSARPDLARQYGVERTPTFVPTNANGNVVGYRGPEWLLQQLAPFLAKRYERGETVPPALAPDAKAAEAKPAEPADLSAVTVVVLVASQETSAARGAMRSVWERMAAGPLRRALEEKLGNRIRVELVFQRIAPDRYRALVDTAGLPDQPFAAIVLVERRFTGLKGFLVGKIQEALQSVTQARLANTPVEIIFERTHPQDFQLLTAALATPDGPAAGLNKEGAADESLPGWLLALLGLLGSGEGLWTFWRKRADTVAAG